jgi:hypothetical protein
MLNLTKYDRFAEAYTVEQAVEVSVHINGEAQRIRIEALRSARTGRYSTTAYRRQPVVAQPTPTPHVEGLVEPPPIEVELWVELRPELQMTNEATADAAIERAMDFLAQRCD